MVVEVLLKLFVHKIDHQLFKGIEIENFKSSDIQHPNVVDFFHGWIDQGIVTHVNKISEKAAEDVFDYGIQANLNSVDILGFGNPFCSNLKIY